MASSAASLREILETRLSRLVVEIEGLFENQLSSQVTAELEQRVARISAAVMERARGEVADQLNQGARRIRQAPDAEQLAATLVEAASLFASGAALFYVTESAARGGPVRGLPEAQIEAFRNLEIPLSSAAALAQAVRSRDPVATVTSHAELSADLAAVAGHTAEGRAFIYPVVVAERVLALLYAWGNVQGSALELFTQLAASVWKAFPAPQELVSIASAKTPSAWDSLSADEQQVHLRAQRFARVQVAEMRLFETDAVQSGRTRRDLYGVLRPRIDAARESFRKSFFAPSASMVDYLHLELVHTLANDDPELLGKDYPGPMV